MKLNFIKILLICLSFIAASTFYSCGEDEPKETGKVENSNYNDDDDDDSGTRWVKCTMCKGSGVCYFCHGDGTFPNDVTTCKYCHGSGKCHQCHGSGRVYY